MNLLCSMCPGRHSYRFAVLILTLALLGCTSGFGQSPTPTNIQISNSILQPGVARLGVNLSDETYWDSGQLTKNLVFGNPGFEGLKYRMVLKCAAVTANTCQDDNQYAAMAANYWLGSSYRIMSGASAGILGTVLASTASQSCSACGMIITFDQNVNMAIGDYLSVETALMPGNGDAGWADDVSGGGTISTETTDLSPETSGKQALLLSASGAGQSAAVQAGFDTWSGLTFIQLNGTFEVTFRAKGVGGNNTLNVSLQRLATGIAAYLSQTVTLTNVWQDYTLTFTSNETGSAVGPVQLQFQASGSDVKLDDVSVDQTNTSSANPTIFRDDVVNALKDLNPGTIRMMASGAALGSDIPNQLQVAGARYREGWNSSGTQTVISYGIHEFLQLCQTVGADPWITIPTATTPAEMTDFIEYLTGDGSDPWSALRVSRGQVAPWTSVFGKVHIELGNETWNGSFKGESMNYPGYPQWANTIFGTARNAPGFVAKNFDLVIDGWASSSGYDGPMLSTSNQHDSMDIAPYLLFTANNEAQSTMFGALFAEPELFESAGGEVYQDMQVAAAAPSATSQSTNVSVYEVNLGTMGGNITKPQLDALTPSIGAGIGNTDHMLQMMRLGVKYQNVFALPQYEFQRGDGNLVRMWGIVVDMGATNRRRPQFLTEAMANSVIGGNMLQVAQTGSNPTWNQPLSSDGVVLNGAHYLQSFAFLNQGTTSTILFNLNQTTPLAVTFSGANAPSGTVQMTQITSTNITDNNEFSTVVQPATQTLSGFNPATGLTLPPFSMTVLTTSLSGVQAPSLSVPAGTYSSAQTVAIADTTQGAAIYYTTDGSAPTATSTAYTVPLSIGSSETLQAIAIVSGSTPSSITSAAYVIGSQTAATPTFSLASGTYTSAQTVAISDATAGSTIYYTNNGSTPTTSSSVYSVPLTVGTSETLQAIAVVSDPVLSPVATATYTIQTSAAAPVFSIPGGSFTTSQTVGITDATANATLYFTTNGSAPTTSSTVFSGPITVSATETLKAIAVATGYSNSAVTSAVYSFSSSSKTATPVFSVPAGTYYTPQKLTLSDSTPGAVIYYTTNVTTPTTASTLYTGPISITGCDYVEAIAVAPGYAQSTPAAMNYNLTVALPTFSVPSGTYSSARTVTITDVTPGATIFYTTNGSAPSTQSKVYTSPILVSASESVIALAAEINYANSAVDTAKYTIATSPATAAPVFNHAGGNYDSAQIISISDATPGATIHYTLNGTTPTTASAVYRSPFEVGNTATLKAIAVAEGDTASRVTTATYTLTVATPQISLAPGSVAGSVIVTITCATPNVEMLAVTTNGTTPALYSPKYTGPITITKTTVLKVIGIQTGYTNSRMATTTVTVAP